MAGDETIVTMNECGTKQNHARATIANWFSQIKDPKITAVLVVGVLLSVTFPSCLILLFVSFGGGLLLGYFILSPGIVFPNLLLLHLGNRRFASENDELSLIKKICPVCGKEKCARHRPELNLVALQPSMNLRLPETVNNALEEFLNLVLKEHIYTWYKDLSEDESFLDEIRTSLRFIVSVLMRRLQKVDIPKLVMGKVLNVALRHLHVCLQACEKDLSSTNREQKLLDLYGCNLHCSLRNRQSEIDYIKHLADRLFPHVLPPQSIKCKSLCVLLREVLSGCIVLPAMDVLADPDKVNNLLLIVLDKSPLYESPDPPSNLVPVLVGFSHSIRSKNDTTNLQLKLSDILSDPELLFPFMQFMKSEASVNVLQFYLSIEEFNGEILTPELSHEQMKDLHHQLQDLYQMYIDPTSINCIRFDDDIILELKTICEGSAEGVIKLQTTTPLFRTYEHAYDLLEHTFLPLFHQSDDYYSMLCGKRLSLKLQRSMSKSAKHPGDPLSLSGIGTRIKTAFRSNTVEGRPISEVNNEYTEIASLAVSMSSENGNGIVVVGELTNNTYRTLDDGGPLRDLSAWRVSIPQIVPKPDPENNRKNIFVFEIEIRRIDVLENDFEASNWVINRRYHEFYVLEQKLIEFHGEFEDVLLPSKRTFVLKNKTFLESQRENFEQYLQKLLTKPVLRGSELLYSFLTSELEFTTSFLEVNLGKKVKSGALKLVKERGQHLEPFLKSFLQSTESPKSRPSRWSDKDSDTVSISSEKMSNSIYNNNANCDLDDSPGTPCRPIRSFETSLETSIENINGVYNAIIYLAVRIYDSPFWLIRSLLSLRSVLANTFNFFLEWYLSHKLEKVLQEYHIVKIIHILRDALFFDNDPPRTDEEKRQRQENALSELKSFIPKLFVTAVGREKHENGTRVIFDLLQLPRLNKQLSYMLLDAALEELFPELVAKDDDYTDRLPLTTDAS